MKRIRTRIKTTPVYTKVSSSGSIKDNSRDTIEDSPLVREVSKNFRSSFINHYDPKTDKIGFRY